MTVSQFSRSAAKACSSPWFTWELRKREPCKSWERRRGIGCVDHSGLRYRVYESPL